jgi:hypothetical protein
MAELYIVDGFNDPIDISYYTEEEKEEFFKLSPSARKVDQQEVEPVEAKIKGSVAGAGALSKNVAPTTVSDLEIGSVDLQDNAKLKIDGTEYSVSSIKEKYGDINSYMKSFKDAGKGDEIEIIYPKAKTIKTISEQSNVKDYDKFVVPTTEEKDNIQLQVDDLSLAKVKTTSRIAEGGKTMQSFTTVVQPYEKEMNAAKAQLKKLNLPLTPENVEKYTRENIYKNKVFDLQKEKANEYFDDIDTGNAYQNKKYQRKLYDDIETRKVLNENKLENDSKILKKTVEYFKDPNTSRNKNLASFNDAITNPGDRFKDVPEDELVLLENGNKVPKKVFEKYQSLIGTAEMERDYLIKSVEQINETSKNFSQGFKDLDLVSRNYDLFEQVIATAANSISDATLSGFIAISDVAVALPVDIIKASDKKYSFKNPVEKFKNDLNYFRNKSNEELQKNYAYKPEFGSDINPFSKDGSWSNLGNFATLGLAGQTGTLLQLSMGSPGLYALGASTYGRTISNIEIADKESKSTTGNLEKRLTALGYATSEVTLGALPTQRLLSNAYGAATAVEKEAFIGGVFNFFKGNYDVIPMSFATEYVSEGATGLVQNVVDITRGEKNITQIMEGVPEQAFTGGLLGPMISSVPFIKGMAYSHFSSWNDLKEYRTLAETVAVLNKELETMDGRTKEARLIRLNIISQLTGEMDAIIEEKGKSILDNISPDGANLYKQALVFQEELRIEAEALINDKKMDPDIKAARLKSLKSEFDYYEIARNNWLSDFQDTFSVETKKVRENYLNKAAADLGLKRGKDSETKIEQKAIDLYTIDKIKTANDNAVSLITTIAKGDVNVTYDYSDKNDILLINLKNKLEELVEQEVFSQEKADEFFKEQSKLINSSKVNGANVRYFNPSSGKTENIIFVSEANALKNRRSQTPIHEITHTILAEAIAKNPQNFGPLANGILTYLAENNSAAYFRVASRTQGQNPEEVLTVFIEEVASGRLDLEANNETKDWTALFGAELNNAMGAKNSFRNVSDIVEFLKTLGYKINSGTFSLADLKTIQEKGLPNVQEGGKTPDDVIKENLKEPVKRKSVSEEEDLEVKKSEEIDVKSMSRAFDNIVVGKRLRSNEEFKTSDNGQNLIDAFDIVSTNEKYNSYVNSLITRDSSLGSLPPNIRQDINRQIKEGVQDRITKNYNPMFGGSFQSLFSFVYGDAKGRGGRTQSALLDIKKQYIKQPKTTPLITSEGTSIDVIDSSKGADEIFDDKLKTRKRNISKLGRGLTLRGKKLVTIENSNGVTLQDEIETAALETFKGSLPDVDSKKYQQFVLNQENPIRKAIQQRAKSTADFKQLLKEFNGPLYKSYPLSVLVQMDKNNEVKTLIKEIKKNISPTEVDKAIAENKLPKNTSRTSGPTLYEHGAPTDAQLNNFFFGDNVAPSTKGTRKDAFFRGLAQKLIYDMAPEAARRSGISELEIVKMAAKINVDPTIKFSYSNIFDLQLEGARKINTLLKNNELNETIDFGEKVLTEDGRIEIVNLFKKDVVVLLPRLAWIGKQGANKFFGSGKDFNISMSTNKKGRIAVNRLREMMNDMLNDPETIFGEPIEGYENGDFSVSSYSTIFKKGSTNSEIKEKADKFNNTVGLIHEALWERINASIQKDKTTASGIASYLKLVANNTGHWHKLGAKIWGYSTNPKGITKINKQGKSQTTFYEYEHAMPATAAYLFLMESAIQNASETGVNNDFEAIYKLTMDNFKLIALDSAENKKLGLAKLGRTMPKDWNLIDNVWWQRYFNEAMFEQLGGIDPRSVVDLNEKSMFDLFGIGSDGAQTTLQLLQDADAAAKVNKDNFGIKLSFSTSSSGQIQNLAKYDKAASIARDFNTVEKGISVFDFDDTLARTNSKILVTMPNGKKSKINATEFAAKSLQLESNGAEFDFTEFNKVVDGKKGPLADLALKRQGKFGSKDIFVLTARPQLAAEGIKMFLDGIGLSLPIENITGLENGSPQAKANWVIDKAAEGYNNFYFADDAIKNVKAVKEILDQIDVKSKVQLAKYSKEKDLNTDFNEMIERSSGIKSYKEYSESKSFRVAGTKGYNYFIPPSAEDFAGLMYPLYGKNKQGDRDMKWVKENLLDPFNKAENAVTQAKISVANDYRKLKKNFKTIPKTLRTELFDGFTYSDALRVSIWSKQGLDIPGLSKADQKELIDFVENNEELSIFSNELIKIQKGKPYPSPEAEWLAGTITTDIMNGINKVNRAEYLQEWQQNVDVIFSDKNINKLRAAYGKKYVEALQNILKRMKTGSNKAQSSNRIVNEITDWVNNSVGAIMFFNARSAALQTLSMVNFINFKDNNVLAAGLAFANQKQFWADFMYLMNSDFLVARRNGLKINVSESEIADAVKGKDNKFKAGIAYILSKGFLPTQYADSFAIASGGATFYRNRFNKYIKEGMPADLAEQQAFLDFYAIAEETQQSARTDRISMEQASVAGRLILAFANTPMQYARLIKKASLDLKNGRGDWKTNVSKIAYYGLVQNLIFNALQNAMFAMMFDEDEENLSSKKLKARRAKEETKALRVANGMADSLLRGTGIYGAGVATLKNIIFELYNQSKSSRPKYEDAALELLTFSPPIDSKVTKFRSALRTFSWNAEEIRETGFNLKNPAYLASGQVISAFTNIPMDRVFRKINNIKAAGRADTEAWQSLALLAGWSEWELGVTDPNAYVKKKKKSTTKKRKRRLP